jgi:LiaI-LiaF-like transmembrane region
VNAKRGLYLQAIRGPVLLITVGALFAIHQAGLLSFSRTWPLIIIVIGIMKLLERAFSPAVGWPQGTPAPYPYPAASAYGPVRAGSVSPSKQQTPEHPAEGSNR